MPPRKKKAAAAAEADEAGAHGDDEEEPQTMAEQHMVLSKIGRTVDGSGFAYTSLSCTSKHIGPIKAIAPMVHLQHIDLSHNLIKDLIPMKGLKYALVINLAHNSISNLKVLEDEEGPAFPNLTHLDLGHNRLAGVTPLAALAPALKVLNFAQNTIATMQDFGGHEKLEELNLAGNKLTSLEGLGGMPALKRLDVSANELTSAAGLADVPELATLRLAGNPIEEMDGPWDSLTALRSLDLSGCKLSTSAPLEALRKVPLLEALTLRGNPFTSESIPGETGAAEGVSGTGGEGVGEGGGAGGGEGDAEADGETCKGEESQPRDGEAPISLPPSPAEVLPPRVQVLLCHWRLKTIDDEPVTDEELEQARLTNVRRLEEERARKAEEEAAEGAGE